MKNTVKFLLLFLLIQYQISNAQVGIGTLDPDSSSILELKTTNKGVLIPRMTTDQRNLIVNPTIGLLIYNTSSTGFNYYDAGWKQFGTYVKCFSINGSVDVGVKSSMDMIVPEMSITPNKGKYSVTFDSQFTNNLMISSANTDTLLSDFYFARTQLLNLPITNSSRLTYGGGETIGPGKCEVAGAISISGSLTLDAGGDPNALFVFKTAGALSMVAGTTIILKNGALPENVFWVSDGAISIGAETKVKGIIMSSAAISVADLSTLDGKMLTNAGAIAFGTGTCTNPSKESSIISLGTLSTFVAFSGVGAISNAGPSFYNGNIATGSGSTASLAAATVNGTIFPPGYTPAANSGYSTINTTATFSIYQGGVLVPNSVRKLKCNSNRTNLSLQTIVDVTTDEAIDVRWNISSGTLALGNRILTLTSVK